MIPKFFSEFSSDDYFSAGLRKTLSENILGIDTYNIDTFVVDYFSRRNSKVIPPFDLSEVVKKMDMLVTYDDFGDSKYCGTLYKPRQLKNQTDFFRISINDKLKDAEKRFTVAHEIAERMLCFKGNEQVYSSINIPCFRNTLKEQTCNKIGREAVMPTKVIENLGQVEPSLDLIKSLAGTYEVPASQMTMKVIDDLKLMDAAILDKEIGKLYGNKGLLIGNAKIPSCEYGCHSCYDKKENKIAEVIDNNVAIIRNGGKVEGIISEGWEEMVLPNFKTGYFIAYKPK
ncbi:MAG: ImmA/IrrE family metallo-endopeptidase [Candidatus Aenigmatarchaeota archaeon]